MRQKKRLMLWRGEGVTPTPPTPFDNTYSLDFDGVDDYVDCGSFTPLDGGTALTISGWFKSGTYTTAGVLISLNLHFDIYQGSAAAVNTKGRFTYRLRGTYGNSFKTLGGVEVPPPGTGAGDLCDGDWHHICFVWDDSTTTAIIYEDGVAVITDTSTTGTLNSATGNLYIGEGLFAGASVIQGNIDEVAIWDTALSPTDVATISAAPTNLTSLNPVAWYRMGDSGTFFNGNWELKNQPQLNNWSSHSMEFDGVDDLINFGNWQLLDGASACTISFWIKSGVDASNAYVIARVESTAQFTIFQAGTSTSIKYRLYTGTHYTVQGGAVLDDEWHHCMMVYNGSTLEVFEDGVSVGSTAVTGTLPVSTSELRVASYAGGSPFKSGNIDDIAIFDSAKAIGDVWDGSGSPTDLTSLSPVGYWRMGEDATWDGSDWTIPDASTNSNDGTSDGMDEEDKVNNAPDNINQGLSSGMDEVDKVEETP